MPLAAGEKIGGYEIVALMGAGGMGEVYRARDARLGRDVAIKIISPRIAADAAGLLRFEREARALASLNHPNIAAIYGVEDTAGPPALILELVDGETLADRIARGPLSVADALAIARQIADALDLAHEAGIVHRDLKPANIKITGDGRVKVLDFGLAKAVAAATHDAANDPAQSTITIEGTQRGVIVGTAAYMSPEHARGKTIDKRTDIWAFGCVLFEMLSGRRPFQGETTSDVIAAIIERQPDWSKLPAALPPHLRRVIERCLEKDPKRRARDIADVAAQLDIDAGPAAERPPAAGRMLWIATGTAALALAALLGLAMLRWSAPMPAPPPAVEFTFGPPADHTFVQTPSLSPDGRLIAFMARDADLVTTVWIRPLDGGVPRRLDGTQGAASRPVWSPDSRSLAFVVGDAWKRINVDGGPLVTIVPGVVADLGASWGPDDTFLVALANRTILSRVPAAGGQLEAVTTLDVQKENSHRWPHVLPDGRHFLFTARSDRPENLGIKIGAFGSPDVRPLVSAPSPAMFAEPGWLLFMTPDEVLMAQRLQPSTWSLLGPPQPLAAPVRYNGPSFFGAFDVSRDGRVLLYTPGARTQSALAWLDRSGRPLGTVGPERRYRALRLSPDGRRAAIELADERYGTRDIWLLDLATNALTRLTADSATDWRPVFSPDGHTVAFASDRAGASTVFRTNADGSGRETVVYRSLEGGAFPSDWSRDGTHILVQLEDRQGRRTGFVSAPIDGSQASLIMTDEQREMTGARYSPEGDRIAFGSNVTGNPEIYVMSLADRRRVRVSTDGGINPVWGRDGKELYFYDERGALMLAALESGPAMVRARPAVAMRPCESSNRIFTSTTAEPAFDVSADGSRILARCDSRDATATAHTVVVNWQSRLR